MNSDDKQKPAHSDLITGFI